MRSFVAVAEHGSFRKAAETLHLSQPALSAHVRDLELLVGVPLFHRTTRSVQLTTEGANFLARARRAFAELEAGLGELRDQASLQRGRVVVGCVPTIASFVLPTVLVSFTKRFPAVAVRIVDVGADLLLKELLGRAVDIGIGPRPEAVDDVLFKTVVRDRFVAVCPREHPLASRRTVRLKDLASFPLLVLASGDVRTTLQRAFEKHNYPFRPAYELVHHYTLGGMVEAGLGITALPSMTISMLSHPKLRKVKLVEPEITREVGVLQRRDHAHTPAVRAFLEALQGGLATLGDSRLRNG